MTHRTGFHDGRLGIGLKINGGGDGTGKPRYPLDVNGDIRLSGAIVDSSGNPIQMMAQQRTFPKAITTVEKQDIGDGTVFGASNWETQQPTGVIGLTVTPYNIGLKSSAGGTVTGQTYSHSSVQPHGSFDFELAFDGGNGGWTTSGSTSDKYNDSSPYEYMGSQVTINIGETKNVTVTTARLQNNNQIVDTADLFIYGVGFVNYLNIQVGDTVTYEHPTLGSQTTTVSQVFTGGSNSAPYMITLADNHDVAIATAISSCTFHNKKEGLAGSWGQIDIGQNSVISSFSITGNSDYTGRRPSNFYLLGSLDGTNWTTIKHEQNPTYSGHTTTCNLSEVQGLFRYYRITVLNLSGYSDSRVSIDEIELFGALESQTYGGNSVDLYRNSSVTIGDTSADITNKLFVNGNTKIGGDLQLNGILKDSSGNARIFSNWTIASNTTDLYRPSGNVGIGTTTPQTQLDVSGTITSDVIVSKTNTLDNLNVGVGNPDYTFSVETKITASDVVSNPGGGDRFGYSVAIDGNYAIVGAYNDLTNGVYTGSAYIFNVTTGTELHKLIDITSASGDSFGWSVAISGNYAIVGASGVDTGKGATYVFNVTTGTQVRKLIASDAAQANDYDQFGKSVAIDGNYAIVGSPYDDDGETNAGSAYIFNVTTGTQLHKLTASNAANTDIFGISVAISGNYAVVGAYYSDDMGVNSGSAYIFNVTTGTELHKLSHSDIDMNDMFGYSVAIDGNYAVIGAYAWGAVGSTSTGMNRGRAYIYNVQTGTPIHTLSHSDVDVNEQDRFGQSVAISGNYAIVGCKDNDDNGSSSGSAYIFDITTGTQIKKIIGIGIDADDKFGMSVAISGSYAIVGAPFVSSTDGGVAYIYGPSSATPSLLKITNDIPNMVVNGTITSDAITSDTIAIGNYVDYSFSSERKIIASDETAQDDKYGHSVAIYGNYAIVGARQKRNSSSQQIGAAYIYNVKTGEEIHKITSPNPAMYHYFGYSVDIDGNNAIISEPGKNSSQGVAYIYNVSTGIKIMDITPNSSDISNYDYFGRSVAISGNYAIIGASNDDSNKGSAYIFNVTTGTQLFKLIDPNGQSDPMGMGMEGSNFGWSVAIDGNYAVVGANGHDSNKGCAFIYNVTTGTQLHKLVSSVRTNGDRFGNSVAISGDYAVIGAPYEDEGQSNSGCAYVFNVINGTQIYKLKASDQGQDAYFGFSVAMYENYAVIGAKESHNGYNDNGSAYIFDIITGTQKHEVFGSDTTGYERFGVSAGMYHNYIIVGTDSNDSVYIYGPVRPSGPVLSITDDTMVSIKGTVSTNGNVGIGTTSPDRGLCIMDNQNTGTVIGNYHLGYNSNMQEPASLKIFQHLPLPSTSRISDGGGNINPAINIVANYVNSSANSTTHLGGSIQFTTQTRLGAGAGNGHGQAYAAIYGGRHGDMNNMEGEMIFYTSDTTNRASGVNLNPRLTIKGGNVGIGTTNPTSPLDVRLTGSAGRIAQFYSSAAGNNGISIGPPSGSDGDGYIEINAGNSSAHGKHVFIGCTRNGSHDYNSSIVFKTRHDAGSYTYTTAAERMRILYDGRVGINITNPSQKLHVNGHVAIGAHDSQPTDTTVLTDPNGKQNAIIFYNRYYTWAGGSTIQGAPGTRTWHNFISSKFHSTDPYSGSAGYHAFLLWTYCGHHGTADIAMRMGSGNGNSKIWVNGSTTISSDRRIKTNITDVPDDLALEMVRKIPCRYYDYKRDIYNEYDYQREKPNRTIGFIAQEVKEICPEAVDITEYKIPLDNKIYRDLDIQTDNSKNFIIIKDYSNKDLSFNDEVECVINPLNNNNITQDNYKEYIDVSNNQVINIKYINGCNFEILDNIDNLVFGEIILKNKKINDFHTLDKQKLFALNFSATQELDRQQQADKEEIAELKEEIAELKKELNALKTHLGL